MKWVTGVVSFVLLGMQTLYAQRPDTNRLVQALQTWQQKLDIPGMAVLLMQEDSVLLQAAYGYANRETREPLTVQHAFPLASITKTFAAALAVKAEAEGKLKLTDKLVQWLPAHEGAIDPRIELRHVLGQCSEHVPGAFFNYTGRFGWITPVLEKAYGKPFPQLIEENFILALGMQHTQPHLGRKGYEAEWGRVVQGYAPRIDTTLKRVTHVPARWGDSTLTANYGMVSTVGDMAKYVTALNTGKVVPLTSLKKLYTAQRDLKGRPLPMAMAWYNEQYLGYNVVWSYGQLGNVGTMLVQIPELKLALIVLANSAALNDPFRPLEGTGRFSPIWQQLVQCLPIPAKVTPEREAMRGVSIGLHHLYTGAGDSAYASARNAYSKYQVLKRSDAVMLFWLTQRSKDAKLNKLATSVAREIVRKYPYHPKVIYYTGNFYLRNNQSKLVQKQAKRIDAWQNIQMNYFATGCYLVAAEAYAQKDPARAARYLKLVLEKSKYEDQLIEAKIILNKMN